MNNPERKKQQRKVTFGKYVIPVYTRTISLYSQRTVSGKNGISKTPKQ